MKASGSDFSDVKIFYPVDSILSEEISEKIGSIESFYRETIARTDLSSDELERIFSYEDWIRSRLAEPENMPEHLFLRLEEIQTSRVIPLLARAKGFLSARPSFLARSAAASSGLLYRSVIETIVNCLGKVLSPLAPEVTSQDVYLLPPFKLVIKRIDPRYKEEELLVYALFAFHVSKVVLPVVNRERLSFELLKILEVTSPCFGDFFSSGERSDDNPETGNRIGKETGDVSLSEVYGFRKEPKGLIKSPLRNVIVKPFRKEMFTLFDLRNSPDLLRYIPGKLDRESRLAILLTALYQMMDLHPDNIGFEPVIPSAHSDLCNLSFYFSHDSDEEDKCFSEVQELYLENRIDEGTDICFQTDTGVRSPLKKISDSQSLLNALSSDWRLAFFDLEFCMGESNLARRTISPTHPVRSQIPYRGHFLLMQIKDERVESDLLQEIIKDRPDITCWVNRSDTSICRRLSAGIRAEIESYVDEILRKPEYSLSFLHQADPCESILFLATGFAFELASGHLEFWEKIQDDLKIATPLSDDARFRIATRLFPRLTRRQSLALEERKEAVREYLILYEEVKSIVASTPNPLEKMIRLINLPICSSIDRRSLSLKIEEEREKFSADFGALNDFRTEMIDRFAPTYENVIRSMYPLLADTQALTDALNEKARNEPLSYAESLIELSKAGECKTYLFALAASLNRIREKFPELYTGLMGRLLNTDIVESPWPHAASLARFLQTEETSWPWAYESVLEEMTPLVKQLFSKGSPEHSTALLLEEAIRAEVEPYIFLSNGDTETPEEIIREED